MYVHIWHSFFSWGMALWLWPTPSPRAREKSREEAFVPGCQFFHSPYGPRDLPCSAWARRSPAISTWAGDFRTMDKAVRPAYRGERKGETNFILFAFCPREEGRVGSRGHAWDIEVYSKHPEWRKFKWYEDHEKWNPSMGTTFTPEKFVSIETKCH